VEEEQQPPKLYSPLATVSITIFIYLAALFYAAILISIPPLFMHWSSAQATAWLHNNVWVTFTFVAMLECLTLWLVYLFLKGRNVSFRYIGLNKPKVKYIAYALIGFAAYFVLFIVGRIAAKALAPGLDLEQKQEIGFNTTTQGASLLPVFLSLVILPPITEEIVARGFLFGGLRTKLSFVTAAIITSTLFAAAHLGEAKNGLLWIAAIDTFILSLVLCYLREKTSSLWPSIYIHMLKNGLAFIVLFNIVQYFR
jgi:membrane protease YdiL (CAAX protease family)